MKVLKMPKHKTDTVVVVARCPTKVVTTPTPTTQRLGLIRPPKQPKLPTKLPGDPKTWAEIKSLIEDAGVLDTDFVYLIDVGPDLKRIFINRDVRFGRSLIEIGDNPTVVANDLPGSYRDCDSTPEE